jgi:glycosyltransferase involved in cell wall biosynthesis
MKSIKLTIVIPFYGRADEKLLKRCLDSIGSQGLDEGCVELLLIDRRGEPCKAPGELRNEGIDRARGEYLLFVDADDRLLPDGLKRCLELADRQHPDILSFAFVTAGSRPPKRCGSVRNYPTGADFMARNNIHGTVWHQLLRTEMIRRHEIRFSERRYHEDEGFVAKCYAHAGRVTITDIPVYEYNRRADSITHNSDAAERAKRTEDFMEELIALRDYRLLHARELPPMAHEALERRIHFLTIDFVRQLLRNRCSAAEAKRRIGILKTEGLLPLPDGRYSLKFNVARSVINMIAKKL